ncbi:histidine phosphatase superfamily protein (branch 2) [Mucilaginibacter gracilis]|uniref:Multiple inositol polyphosphate phosphatase 1 n=1 Tax=Mucilaginibacter gracilis TaxID=423350 RepID=A0A495J446_9SPHI|nr:histidine-type phosphatase [Mucilaginibacter gracilis]RKR83593.1 histidine phosphatase superfamily protein (branch 2) [Mucilaginibacter gracilis]
MLKYFKATLLLLVLCTTYKLKAQTCNYPYLGTKTLYSVQVYKNTVPPARYQPIFINHVGRHGARHLTKEVNTSFAYKLLMHADSAGALTAEGQKLKDMVMALDKVEHGKVKSISGGGREELQGIGQRMFNNYPKVFAGSPRLNVAITKEIRTKQSADAFLNGLKAGFLDSAKISEYTDDTDLRFYDASPTYTAFEDGGNWQTVMHQLEQKLKIADVDTKIINRWIKPAFTETLKPAEIEKLVSDIFGFATIVPSLRVEIAKADMKPGSVNFISLFNCDEIEALSKIDVADDYLKKGPGTNKNGIQVRIAVPLLVNFINTTDQFIKNGDINAELRFAHAETISPFATLLGIDKASLLATDINQLSQSWRSDQVISLSSNIQWVFYRKKGSSNLLVKILLNEREVHINGLATKLFPYYQWQALRAFYLSKLNNLNVKLTDNMADYLKEVK